MKLLPQILFSEPSIGCQGDLARALRGLVATIGNDDSFRPRSSAIWSLVRIFLPLLPSKYRDRRLGVRSSLKRICLGQIADSIAYKARLRLLANHGRNVHGRRGVVAPVAAGAGATSSGQGRDDLGLLAHFTRQSQGGAQNLLLVGGQAQEPVFAVLDVLAGDRGAETVVLHGRRSNLGTEPDFVRFTVGGERVVDVLEQVELVEGAVLERTGFDLEHGTERIADEIGVLELECGRGKNRVATGNRGGKHQAGSFRMLMVARKVSPEAAAFRALPTT
jgi:hypothetical protein